MTDFGSLMVGGPRTPLWLLKCSTAFLSAGNIPRTIFASAASVRKFSLYSLRAASWVTRGISARGTHFSQNRTLTDDKPKRCCFRMRRRKMYRWQTGTYNYTSRGARCNRINWHTNPTLPRTIQTCRAKRSRDGLHDYVEPLERLKDNLRENAKIHQENVWQTNPIGFLWKSLELSEITLKCDTAPTNKIT